MRTAALAALVLLGGATARAEEALPYPAGVSEQVIQERKVTLRIPAAVTKEKPWGFVLAVGGTIEHLAGLSADEYVVCLASPRLDKSGARWSGSETKELWALVDHLAKVLPVDPKRMHAVAMEQSIYTIFPATAFGEGSRFVSATLQDSQYTGGTVAPRAKKEMGVLAYRWQPSMGDGVNRLPEQLGGKVRSVELRDDEQGLSGPYFPWWIRTMEGRFVPGEDRSFPWVEDVKTLDELKKLVAQKAQAALVYVFAAEDAASPDAKALHLETFLDDRVRRAGRALLAVEVDRGAKAEFAQALGVKTTPTLVVFKKDGTEAARFEGAVKLAALVKAMETAQKK